MPLCYITLFHYICITKYTKIYSYRQLDLTDYVINKKHGRAVYDLHAVSVSHNSQLFVKTRSQNYFLHFNLFFRLLVRIITEEWVEDIVSNFLFLSLLQNDFHVSCFLCCNMESFLFCLQTQRTELIVLMDNGIILTTLPCLRQMRRHLWYVLHDYLSLCTGREIVFVLYFW